MSYSAPGSNASTPQQLPLHGWKRIFLRVWSQMGDDNLNLVAAGIAMFTLLAIAPALVATVSVYGLFADPADVASQLASLRNVMPGDALALLIEQVEKIASRDEDVQGFAVLFGVLLALWSARRGVVALIKGLNIAYFEREKRGFFRQIFLSLAFTGAAIMAACVVTLLAVMVPIIVEITRLGNMAETVVLLGRWTLLWVLVVAAIGLLYRLGPSRDKPRWRWLATGSVVAATIWLLASMGFAFYVSRFGGYGETYGAMGGVVVLLLWFQISAFVVLMGARLNAEMEHQTALDTTTGPARPMGRRGAVVADSLPDSNRPEQTIDPEDNPLQTSEAPKSV